MSATVLLRASALVLGILGAVDPSWRVRREMPRPVDLQVAAGDRAAASAIVERLGQLLGADVTFAAASPAIARVVVGRADERTWTGVPTSFVTLDPATAPNVRIAAIADPRPAITGWKTSISAALAAHAMAGSASVVVLEQAGVELARAEHTWSQADERAIVSLPYVPPVDGATRLSLRILPLAADTVDADNVADVRVIARSRRLRVLVHEPRPSWAASFVRRVLEENPAFDVSALAVASKGIAVKAGAPPARLDDAIDAFDAVIVGAPEELTAVEVTGLTRFARSRGGSILLLPDRRPSGPYLSLLRSQGFDELDELLVEKPMIAKEPGGGSIRATELVVPRGDAGDVIASTPHDAKQLPVVFTWPIGAGRVVFSGALDAWRFRGSDGDAFGRFWTAIVSGAALAAPDRIELSVDPGVTRPGDDVSVQLRVRASEIDEGAGEVRTPAVQVRLISSTGTETAVRMWPADEPGTFEGTMSAPAAGRYDLQATVRDTTVDTVIVVADDVRRPREVRDRQDAIAAATGGIVTGAGDLAPLVQALRALPAPQAAHEVHPARSVWFVAAFAALLCGEWVLRRRSGLR